MSSAKPKSGKSPRARVFPRDTNLHLPTIVNEEKSKDESTGSTTPMGSGRTSTLKVRGGRSARRHGNPPWTISGDVSVRSGKVAPENILWIEVHATLADSISDFKAGVKRMLSGRGETLHSVSMKPEELRAFLSSERFRLVKLIRRHKPSSVYELAKLSGRDRMAVTMDLKLLEALRFVRLKRSSGTGRARSMPIVPYEAIRIAIDL